MAISGFELHNLHASHKIHGARRRRDHSPPLPRRNSTRSCSRDWRPCQNSIIAG